MSDKEKQEQENQSQDSNIEDKPNTNIDPPDFDYVTEGYDPNNVQQQIINIKKIIREKKD